MDEIYEYDYRIFNEHYSLPLHEVDSEIKERILLVSTIHLAKNGFSSVTMRDIAKITGVQQSSMAKYFENKDALWLEIIEHTRNLYMLYFSRLDQEIAKAGSFEEVLEVIFHEPKQMRNVFTCYAFSMILAEQFRDERAKEIFCEIFLNYSTEFIQGWLDKCIAKGMVAEFDTKTVAASIMNCTLIEIAVSIHKQHTRFPTTSHDPSTMLAGLQSFILQGVTTKKPLDGSSACLNEAAK